MTLLDLLDRLISERCFAPDKIYFLVANHPSGTFSDYVDVDEDGGAYDAFLDSYGDHEVTHWEIYEQSGELYVEL